MKPDVSPKKNMGFRFGFGSGLKPKHKPKKNPQKNHQTLTQKCLGFLNVLFIY
jgi:hypothetical protein